MESLQICTLNRWKGKEDLCLMTLRSDAKFEESLTLGSKNDMKNLVNFSASSDKSKNVLLLSIAYNTSAKKVQKNYLSWHWKRFKLIRKTDFLLKNDLTNLVNFNSNSGKSENLHFDGLLFEKVCNIWAKKYRRIVSWNMIYGFKNDIRNFVNFHTSSWK